MSRPVARPTLPLSGSPTLSTAGPQGARRTAMRAQLLQPMDDTTRRMIAAVASNGLDEIVKARLLAMGSSRATRPASGRRKRQP